ncbi:MAG: hypothetical protein ACI9EF_000239 [Pseudohongiellaceae bacterium]|jgi:hypothetical protein
MGVVYRGEHLGLGIEVAVKCISPALARQDPPFVVRFEKEARAAALIDDPNVVRVHDVAQASGLHYIAMQYVAGENARQRVERKGPLPVAEAVTIALGASRGLAAAHRAGLVHRDVKPDNILVSAEGEVKLADLELSKMEGDLGMTYTGAAMGTPRYLHPEQYKDAKNVGSRADVYSLGATLYFLFMGSDAIDGESPLDVMMQVCSEDFPRVTAKRPGVPAAVDELVALCTSQDPALRPASGTELVEQLLAMDVGEESLREDQAEMTLLGLIQVSPPPMQTLMRIQATLAGNGASKTERPHATGAATGAAGAGADESLAAKPEPASEGQGKLVWALGVLLVALLAWLLWREFGPRGGETPAVHKSEPRTQDALQPVKRPWGEGAPPAILPPVTLALTSPTVTGELWVTHRVWIRVQGQVSDVQSEEVQLTVNAGAPAVFRLDEEGRFGFHRGVSSGDPQHFSLTTAGLLEPVNFAVVQDAVSPVIHIVSPTTGERLTKSDSIDIELIVMDEHLATVMVGSRVLQFLGNGRVVGNDLPLLRQGDNVLVITATDFAGQKTEETLTVVRDGNAPVLLSVNPIAGGRVLAGGTVDLQLTVDDSEAAVTVDGSRLAVQGSVARGQFSAPTKLGPWSLDYELCDALGNCRSGTVEYIVYEESLVVPPVVLAEEAPMVDPEAVPADAPADAPVATHEIVAGSLPAESPDTAAEPLAEQPPSALADMTYVGQNDEGLPEYDLDLGGVTMRFVSVPAGSFMMGSPDNESFRQEDGGPLHKVTLGAFLMAKYECTQAQWMAVRDGNPSNREGDDLPVE